MRDRILEPVNVPEFVLTRPFCGSLYLAYQDASRTGNIYTFWEDSPYSQTILHVLFRVTV